MSVHGVTDKITAVSGENARVFTNIIPFSDVQIQHD